MLSMKMLKQLGLIALASGAAMINIGGCGGGSGDSTTDCTFDVLSTENKVCTTDNDCDNTDEVHFCVPYGNEKRCTMCQEHLTCISNRCGLIPCGKDSDCASMNRPDMVCHPQTSTCVVPCEDTQNDCETGFQCVHGNTADGSKSSPSRGTCLKACSGGNGSSGQCTGLDGSIPFTCMNGHCLPGVACESGADPHCLTCDEAAPTACTTCKKEYMLSSTNTCIEKCAAGANPRTTGSMISGEL